MKLSEILAALAADGVDLAQGALRGDPARAVLQVASLKHAGDTDIAFLANPRYRPQLATTRAGAVIVRPADVAHAPPGMTLLIVDNPYACYARVAALLNP
ncbi:MAG: UDP-3-O-(3-hydroxymyristoyl)glucosamine N-acyltransferase, partial [Zoogloeaceae bacterium]|nr:UDP-3-O-(3-hydroxymyristoyl)glucosamine N-acyltransferase [Zoogloeaceae bacterium]